MIRTPPVKQSIIASTPSTESIRITIGIHTTVSTRITDTRTVTVTRIAESIPSTDRTRTVPITHITVIARIATTHTIASIITRESTIAMTILMRVAVIPMAA